jgi:hypothetical protein
MICSFKLFFANALAVSGRSIVELNSINSSNQSRTLVAKPTFDLLHDLGMDVKNFETTRYVPHDRHYIRLLIVHIVDSEEFQT